MIHQDASSVWQIIRLSINTRRTIQTSCLNVLETRTYWIRTYWILSNYFWKLCLIQVPKKYSSSCATFTHTRISQDELRMQVRLSRRTTQIVRLDGWSVCLPAFIPVHWFIQTYYRTNYLFFAQVRPGGSPIPCINRDNVVLNRIVYFMKILSGFLGAFRQIQ